MSLSIVFGLRRNAGAAIGELELDATLSELHERESEVTAYPVEQGADVADHISPKPKRVSIEGFVTAAPLKILGIGLGWGQGQQRVTSAFDALEQLRESKELVTIVTSLATYTDMAMERLSLPRDRTTGKALRFTAEFVEVRIVASQSLDIPADRLSALDRDLAAPRVDHGQQQLTVPSPAAKEKATELLELLKGFRLLR